jgi:RNA polymerase sigma-70 factor (ECF subfamily)
MNTSTEKIWIDFNAALRGFILKHVPNQDAADDILQEVFFKIIVNLENLQDDNRIQAWLYRITRNTIADYYRKRDLPVALPAKLENAQGEPETVEDRSAELGPCVQALMGRLPEKYRHSLVLTEFEGLTQKDMGQKLGLTVSGAKSRVQRAKGQMKDLLLDCCQFNLDRRGHVLDYRPTSADSPDCCGDPDCD